MAFRSVATKSRLRTIIVIITMLTYCFLVVLLLLYIPQRALDAVKDHHHSRMALLKDLIEERRQSLEDHQGGRRLLADEDLERTSRQLVNFRRKLAYMEETNSEVRGLIMLNMKDGRVGSSQWDWIVYHRLEHSNSFSYFHFQFYYRSIIWNVLWRCKTSKTQAAWTIWPSKRNWETSTAKVIPSREPAGTCTCCTTSCNQRPSMQLSTTDNACDAGRWVQQVTGRV